jgi:Ca-activated chloride channel family protein
MKKKIMVSGLFMALLGLCTASCSYYEGERGPNFYDFDPSVPSILHPAEGNRVDEITDNPFVEVAEQPTSTFSVDADGASFTFVRRSIVSHMGIDPAGIRIEEFLNYFTFDYPTPTDGNTVAINSEMGVCPWNPSHQLIRLGIKGKELTAEETPRANFVFLVDVSGSMYGSDRLDLLKQGLIKLLDLLNPNDRISLITYSGSVSKLLESTPVSQKNKIKNAINKLRADGSTAGGQAMKMAYEEAKANYDPQCNNRVIMGTDGDFNVGVTSTEALLEMVESYAREGIYLTCLGFGYGNLNDSMMETISNHGNGTYHYIDSENEMVKVFVHERERFVSVANDAKCQVTFDGQMVKAYRLIGYENRALNTEDFENDETDAGEIGAGQTITALYEIIPTEQLKESLSNGTRQEVATFDFRYKKSLGEESIPLASTIVAENQHSANGQPRYAPSENFNFAAGVAAFGLVLRNSPYKGDATLSMAHQLVKNSQNFDPHHYRQQLLELIETAQRRR